MRYVITDIETAPLADAERMLPEFKHNAGTKDEALKAEQIAAKRAKALADAALDPDLCRIVAIGSWWDIEIDPSRVLSEPTILLCHNESQEAAALAEFWETYRAIRHECPYTVIVGSNVLGFDLPVMVRRSLYLQVEVPHLERGKFRRQISESAPRRHRPQVATVRRRSPRVALARLLLPPLRAGRAARRDRWRADPGARCGGRVGQGARASALRLAEDARAGTACGASAARYGGDSVNELQPGGLCG
jgi:hypothetical protein